jgi:hypothetical protein
LTITRQLLRGRHTNTDWKRANSFGLGALDLRASGRDLSSPAKRKVVACGRQVGKTFMAAYLARQRLLAGQQLLYLAPTQDQTDRFWWYLTDWTQTLNGLYKHEGRRLMRHQGGLVLTKTGHTPENLRGGSWDTVLFDECAYLDATIWNEVGAPMLAATDGGLFLLCPTAATGFTCSIKAENEDGRVGISPRANPISA